MSIWFKCPHCGKGSVDEQGENMVDDNTELYKCENCGGIMSSIDDSITYKEYVKLWRKELGYLAEDYVSFETAKLLKEKGFDANLLVCYTPDGLFSRSYGIKMYTNESEDSAVECICPTLQMVMKWLREVYGIFISICNGNHKKDNRDTSTPDNVYYFFVITDDRAVYEEEKQCLKEFISYEEAADAAIKYCLENLI